MKEREPWDPMIPPIEDQLALISQRLCTRMKELDLTPRILEARSGLALNSVKTAMTGKTCNINTLAEVCVAMKWTLFDCFNIPPIVEESKSVEITPQPLVYPPPRPASSILD